jgi:hypothetical protein
MYIRTKVIKGMREYPLILDYIPKTEGFGQAFGTPAACM